MLAKTKAGFKKLFKSFPILFEPLPITVETWAEHNANRATPDGIIAATVVELFVKDFDGWSAKDLEKFSRYGGTYVEAARNKYSPQLFHKGKNIDIKFGVKKWEEGEYDGTKCADWCSEGTTVNGLAVELKAARYIAAGWEKIAKQQEKLKTAAARAKANMERNEAAWNLAEKLLGMKRNEQGALVPIVKADEEKQSGEQTKDVGHQSPGGGGGLCPA